MARKKTNKASKRKTSARRGDARRTKPSAVARPAREGRRQPVARAMSAPGDAALARTASLSRERVRFDVETAARTVLGEDFALDKAPSDPDGLDDTPAAWRGKLRTIAREIRKLPPTYSLHDPTADEAETLRSQPLVDTLEWLTDQIMRENAA